MTGRRRDDRGAVAVLVAVSMLVLMGGAALTIDLGNTWARRGQLQVQADRAATFAANYLPADTTAQKQTVARAVAYYIACHPVGGQRSLDPSIPACPEDDPTSATLASYASALLSRGEVAFPARNQVSVTTPDAHVAFSFARALGAEGTDQRRTATAKVTSPGMLSPMALSLDCLLSTGANVLGGNGLPFGYIATTHQTSGAVATVTTTWPSSPTWTYQSDPQLSGVTPGRVTQTLLGPTATLQVSGKKWPALTAQQRFVVVFARGSGLTRAQYEATGTLTLDAGVNKNRLGYVGVQLPLGVASVAGDWEIKVAVETTVLAVSTRVYSSSTSTLTVDPLVSSGSVSCGRLLKSPRGGTQADINFVLNLQEGIDHLLDQYPTVLSTGGTTISDLSSVASLTQCRGTDVKDTNGVGQSSGTTPVCVVTNMSNAYEAGFTEGLIGAAGRLTCTTARPCRAGHTFTLNGRTLNDDSFSDFVKDRSLLSSDTFFNIDTFLQTDVPVVTPTSNLSRDIFSSHRFMWVAVISTAGATSAVQAGDYPILTFRPIFITRSSILDGATPLLDSSLLNPLGGGLASVLGLVDSAMTTLLQPYSSDQHGLLMDASGKVRAIRFMTISPDALPAVPVDYTGPESEYLGVGPRIIRLVR